MIRRETTLTTIGSRIPVSIEPAVLPEAAGGIHVVLGFHDGPLIVTFTHDEACWLGGAILDVLVNNPHG
jgi:hypothetical protein